MPAPTKYNEVMSIIKRRIQAGDYLVDSIPGERRLAEETGVSYMTARRAVRQLLDEEVLARDGSGSLVIHPTFARSAKPAEVVLLYPAYPSSYLTQLRVVVTEAAEKRGLAIRPGQFVHWDDKAVVDVVEQAKGTVIIPYGPVVPQRLIEHLRANKVVVLDGDFSAEGLPSIRLFSDACIERVLDHFWDLGHRHIDCLNTQNRNTEINRRIAIWQNWLSRKGGRGDLRDDPAPIYTDPTATAYRLMSRLLDEGESEATGFIATTCPAAIGSVRACYERGIVVGRDRSIGSINLEPPSEYFCPSITGLNTPDLTDLLERSFDWFAGDHGWRGDLLMEPTNSSLFLGESTSEQASERSRSSFV
ncbi:lac repressor [Botrimarina colliarenosi]|uniref:Lac repressor n=1 Tax=Botrimarina colliarenosi TaxID=2528001 RepID=A0A5C6A0U0_9BACT|nr:substrate-binding domain-containing protein [Botrimarina colliarenosi]TWT92861.1 lac repressor [Botrimarina colliarenosi]